VGLFMDIMSAAALPPPPMPSRIRRCAWLIIYFQLKNASLMIFFNHLLVLKTMLFLFCWMWPSSPFFMVLVAILLFLCQI
jgi:hypothetical protein